MRSVVCVHWDEILYFYGVEMGNGLFTLIKTTPISLIALVLLFKVQSFQALSFHVLSLTCDQFMLLISLQWIKIIITASCVVHGSL